MSKRTASNEKEFRRIGYIRLLQYVKPYWKRLTIGILAGLIVGGSLFSTFLILPKMMMIVDQDSSSQKKLHAAAEKIVTELEADPQLTKEQKTEAAANILKPSDDDPKLTEAMNSLRKFSEKFDLPIQVGKREIQVSWPRDITFSVIDPSGRIAWQFFAIYVVGFILLWVLKGIATYINHYFTRWVGTRVVMDMRNNIYTALVRQSMSFYGKQDIGHLISRCTNDTQAIESSVSDVIADITRCPIEIIACLAAILYASATQENFGMLLIMGLGLPLCILPIVILSRVIRRIYRKAFANIAEVISRMHETFTGILVIKANNTEQQEVNRFKSANRVYFKNQVRALRMQLLMSPLMELVGVIAILIFLLYSYKHGVTITQMATFLAPALMAYRPIKDLARIVNHIQRSMAAADRYFDLIDTHTELPEAVPPVDFKQFDRGIEFKDVVFAYEPGHNILAGVNLVIPKGRMVAVVGETGSGKTTIANLIARFYDPVSGDVLIDGTPVRKFSIASLRRQIGIVTQDPILFNDTIANNIAYGTPDATREEIIEAAKQANAHEFIMSGSHPLAYDDEVGEKGCVLSGGEKQRVAIARAILKNPPILILDEATSALDTVTEKLVQDALNKVMSNRTVFAIAHRLSTIRNADLIIVLEKGRIVESGTHHELLELGGRYKKLHDTQFARDGENA